jgi:hypothetical protein
VPRASPYSWVNVVSLGMHSPPGWARRLVAICAHPAGRLGGSVAPLLVAADAGRSAVDGIGLRVVAGDRHSQPRQVG